MIKIEKVLEVKKEEIAREIIANQCPHDYGFKSRLGNCTGCLMECYECWGESIEEDSNDN